VHLDALAAGQLRGGRQRDAQRAPAERGRQGARRLGDRGAQVEDQGLAGFDERGGRGGDGALGVQAGDGPLVGAGLPAPRLLGDGAA